VNLQSGRDFDNRMKIMKRWPINISMLLGLTLLLPVAAPAITTLPVVTTPKVEQTAFAYDAVSVQSVSDDVLTGSESSELSVIKELYTPTNSIGDANLYV
jgi:hypothetical protein